VTTRPTTAGTPTGSAKTGGASGTVPDWFGASAAGGRAGARTEVASDTTSGAVGGEGRRSREATLGVYKGWGAKSTEAPVDEAPADDGVIRASKDYKEFRYGGARYKDDSSNERPTQKKLTQKKPLSLAIKTLFLSWAVDSVFADRKGTTLRDEFVWLLEHGVKREIKWNEITAITENASYTSREQKFFYLFYEVVYKYEAPRGFYFSEGMPRGELSPMFIDRADFIARYCSEGAEGKWWRDFYIRRKKEILYFLKVTDEGAFFEEMTFDALRKSRTVVWVDGITGEQPITLDKIDDFIYRMKTPSELSKMQMMINFLKKYRLTSSKTFVRREPEPKYALHYSERGEHMEDDCIYEAAGIVGSAQYATEYDCYITLLREYIRTFSPAEVEVGGIRFTRRDYSAEIEELVKLFCEAFFGDANDEAVFLRKKRVWLAKSLYEREALFGFVCENAPRIERLFGLITEPDIAEYFELFHSPKVIINGKARDIGEYISIKADGVSDIYSICGMFRENSLISEYLKKADTDGAALSSLFSEYDRLYDTFKRNS